MAEYINNNTDHSPITANCTITKNSGNDGGGIFNYNASPDILNCIIANNIVNERGFYKGGAGGIDNSMFGSPKIINCLIAGNKGDNGGGIIL